MSSNSTYVEYLTKRKCGRVLTYIASQLPWENPINNNRLNEDSVTDNLVLYSHKNDTISVSEGLYHQT